MMINTVLKSIQFEVLMTADAELYVQYDIVKV